LRLLLKSGCGITRRERLLRLAQDQKQVDQQNQIDAAAKASVVNRPAQSMTTNPGSINVGGVDLSGGNTEVSTPASSQFDPAAFSGRLKAIDPLMAQNYDAQQVSIQQKQQDEALARQQKLVQLQNGLADLDTKDRAAADAKRKQIKEVTGKAAQSRVGHQKRSARAKGRRSISMFATPAMQDPHLAQSGPRDARAVHAGD
jgi:hypothetical protein